MQAERQTDKDSNAEHFRKLKIKSTQSVNQIKENSSIAATNKQHLHNLHDESHEKGRERKRKGKNTNLIEMFRYVRCDFILVSHKNRIVSKNH